MEEEEDICRAGALRNITSNICNEIEEGKHGAIATEDPKHAKFGCCVVQFLGDPFADQETGELMVKAQWCDEVGRANHWCAFNELADDHKLQHVLCAD